MNNEVKAGVRELVSKAEVGGVRFMLGLKLIRRVSGADVWLFDDIRQPCDENGIVRYARLELPEEGGWMQQLAIMLLGISNHDL